LKKWRSILDIIGGGGGSGENGEKVLVYGRVLSRRVSKRAR
jgi:hypothetical protein